MPGNRLTQKMLPPQAFLHRPDGSSEAELDKGLTQAAYHVPLNDSTLQHLCLCGLNWSQREAVIKQYWCSLFTTIMMSGFTISSADELIAIDPARAALLHH